MIKLRELAFSRAQDTINPRKLYEELAALPELAPWRDGLGNEQASYWLKFDEAGDLVVVIPEDTPTDGVRAVVEAHDPTPPDDAQRGERMREKVNHYIDIATEMATKIRAGDATPAEQRFALAAVLDATARLARLQLRELDAES